MIPSRSNRLTRCPNYNFIPASPTWHGILVRGGYTFIYQPLNSPFLDTIDIVRQRTMRNNISEARLNGYITRRTIASMMQFMWNVTESLNLTLTNRFFWRRFFYKSRKISAMIVPRHDFLYI